MPSITDSWYEPGPGIQAPTITETRDPGAWGGGPATQPRVTPTGGQISAPTYTSHATMSRDWGTQPANMTDGQRAQMGMNQFLDRSQQIPTHNEGRGGGATGRIPEHMQQVGAERRQEAIQRLQTNPPAHLTPTQVQSAIDRLRSAEFGPAPSVTVDATTVGAPGASGGSPVYQYDPSVNTRQQPGFGPPIGGGGQAPTQPGFGQPVSITGDQLQVGQPEQGTPSITAEYDPSANYRGTRPGQQPQDTGIYDVNSTAHSQTNLDSPGPARTIEEGRSRQAGVNDRGAGDPYNTGMFETMPQRPPVSTRAPSAQPGGQPQPTGQAGGQPAGNAAGDAMRQGAVQFLAGQGGQPPPPPSRERPWQGNQGGNQSATQPMTITQGIQEPAPEQTQPDTGTDGEVAGGPAVGSPGEPADPSAPDTSITEDGMTQGDPLSFEWGPDGGPEHMGDVPEVPGPTFWDVTGDELVQDRLTDLFKSGSPVLEAFKSATERAHLARGGQNRLMAQQAGVAALADMAFNIASQDAQTIARSREFNAAMANQYGLAQQTFIYNALLSDQNFGQAMEMQREQIQAEQARLSASLAAQASQQAFQRSMQREAFQHAADMTNLQHGQALELMGSEYGLMMDRDTLQADLNLRNQYTLADQAFGHQTGLADQAFGHQWNLNNQAQANELQRMGYGAQLGEWQSANNFGREMALQMGQNHVNMLGMYTDMITNMSINGATTGAIQARSNDWVNMANSLGGLDTSFYTNGANPYQPGYASYPRTPGAPAAGPVPPSPGSGAGPGG